ncbi:MAG: thioredoxin domain-containing protein, partial [Desulfobulbaceae bacterium]|nr:thioredoxin domain-containing protein [Desulfobulbaceae bacterium]
MKKVFALCALLLLPTAVQAKTPPVDKAGGLDWSVQKSWKMTVEPVDFVQSLDNKKVFVLGTDSHVHIFSVEGEKLGSFPVDKNVTAIDIAPRGEMVYLMNSKDKSYTALAVSFTKPIDITGSPFIGNENALVALVVFSDFQCGHCGKVPLLLDQVLEQNSDTVKVVFKHLPLRMHPQAEPAARAAIAAQNQSKFWQMHDALFESDKLDMASIKTVAAGIGLDMDQFKKDIKSQATRQQLQKDMMDARKADVTGTP